MNQNSVVDRSVDRFPSAPTLKQVQATLKELRAEVKKDADVWNREGLHQAALRRTRSVGERWWLDFRRKFLRS